MMTKTNNNSSTLQVFLLAALIFASATGSTSALRGGDKSNKIEVVYDQRRNVRRHLLPADTGLDCVLYMRDIDFEDGSGEETWCCEFHPDHLNAFSEQDYRMFANGDNMICIEGVSNEAFQAKGALSGISLLKIHKAFIEEPLNKKEEKKLVIEDDEDDIEVEPLPESDARRGRNLASSQPGTVLKTLVVRVIDAGNKQIEANAAQLRNDVFEDDLCLKSQYEACSHNQLKIEPADEGDGGIVDLPIDMNVDGGLNYITAGKTAMAELKKVYGTGDNSDGHNGLKSKYGLVLFCMPPGTYLVNWLAYAYVNSLYSFYKDIWCSSSSAQMHEVGHSLNLAHSGHDGNAYGDQSGYMGYSYVNDDGPAMCFNAANNYQLGWYKDQIDSINPIDLAESGPMTITLNGVEDYDFGKTSALISLRLEKSGGKDYYIGYNKAPIGGINQGTQEGKNQVLLVEKESGPTQYGQSWLLAALNWGNFYTIEEYAGKPFDVTIKVDSIQGKDAIITINTVRKLPQLPEPCPSGTADLKLKLKTDNYGSETTWKITKKDSPEETIYEGSGYEKTHTYQLPNEYTGYCLAPGDYVFTVNDSYGDGMCCKYGHGGYEATLNGDELFVGSGEFTREKKHFFSISSPTSNPTRYPTSSPTSRSPTGAPTISHSGSPTGSPSGTPTKNPSGSPSESPSGSFFPSSAPSMSPTVTAAPSALPSSSPSTGPTGAPTTSHSSSPSSAPSGSPSSTASGSPTSSPSESPSATSSDTPTASPTDGAPSPSASFVVNAAVPVGTDLNQVEADFEAATLALLEKDGISRRRNVRTLASSSAFVVTASASKVACSAANDISRECLTVDITISSKKSEPVSMEKIEEAAVATAEAVEDGTFVEELKNTSTGSNVAVELPPAVTGAPTSSPTSSHSVGPTGAPTALPTALPTANPTAAPTALPTANPTKAPTSSPVAKPVCKDTKEKLKLKYSGKKIKGKCKSLKKRKLCDWKDYRGIPVIELCPVSCKQYIPDMATMPCKL